MRVKFHANARYIQNNARDSREYVAGQEYDLADDHAQRWIRRGLAVEVPPTAVVEEVVTAPEPEQEPSAPEAEPTTKATKKAK